MSAVGPGRSGGWRAGIAKRCALIACALAAGAGCDLVVETGETLVLGDRGVAFGSGGNAQTAPLPAVRVRSGGTVVVQDADVFGGGILVEEVGQTRFVIAGPGILSDLGNGTIRVQNGTVAGGPVVVRVSEQMAPDTPAAGIRAIGANVEISGGTIRGGSILSEVGGPQLVLPGPAVEMVGGTLRVTGGTFVPGSREPLDPFLAALRLSVRATGAQLEIRGGIFSEGFGTTDSRSRIFGGVFESLAFVSSTPSGCSELRGGLLSGLAVHGGRVIVAGTGLAITPMTEPGASILTGTLESGEPLNARVIQRNGAVIQLVTPGSPGCP